MKSWLLWLPGLRGPSPQRLENRGDGSEPVLDHGERKYKLASPVRIAEVDLGLGLDELARAYPAPQQRESDR